MPRDDSIVAERGEKKTNLSAHDRPDQERLYIVLKKSIWSSIESWCGEECRQNRSRKIIKNKSGRV